MQLELADVGYKCMQAPCCQFICQPKAITSMLMRTCTGCTHALSMYSKFSPQRFIPV